MTHSLWVIDMLNGTRGQTYSQKYCHYWIQHFRWYHFFCTLGNLLPSPNISLDGNKILFETRHPASHDQFLDILSKDPRRFPTFVVSLVRGSRILSILTMKSKMVPILYQNIPRKILLSTIFFYWKYFLSFWKKSQIVTKKFSKVNLRRKKAGRKSENGY